MSKTTKILRTLVVVGVVGGLAALGVFSAFSSQTDNPGNVVTAGSVTLTDNDAGTALYNIPAGKPGDSQTSCIRVAYSGSLDANVKLYTPSTIGALGPEREPEDRVRHAGLAELPELHRLQRRDRLCSTRHCRPSRPPTRAGVADFPGTSATKWVNGDAVVYRVTATLSASTPDTAQGATTGSHTLRWEAQNQ